MLIEYLELFWEILVHAQTVAFDKVKRYLWATLALGSGGLLLVLLAAVLAINWPSQAGTFALLGFAVVIVLTVIFSPILLIMRYLHEAVEPIRWLVRIISFELMLGFFVSLYLYVVPVPEQGMLSLLAFCGLLASVTLFCGVGVTKRFVAQRLGIIFFLLSASFLLATFLPAEVVLAAGKLPGKAGHLIANVLDWPAGEVHYQMGMDLFDSKTGQPLYTFHEFKNGNEVIFELWDKMGVCPRHGVALKWLDHEALSRLEAWYKKIQASEVAKAEALAQEAQRLREVEHQKHVEVEAEALKKTQEAQERLQGLEHLRQVEAKAREVRMAREAAAESQPTATVAPSQRNSYPQPTWVEVPAGTAFMIQAKTSVPAEHLQLGEVIKAVSLGAFDTGSGYIPQELVEFRVRVAPKKKKLELQVLSIGIKLQGSYSFDHYPFVTEIVTLKGESTGKRIAKEILGDLVRSSGYPVGYSPNVYRGAELKPLRFTLRSPARVPIP
ncbi:MAG: hypothetical protein COV31_03065 [Candidatus Yanofskybacteria bacterium CG10_big_fil_rev_8_21_14_0_10_46_23]|uniref:Uncharacterized protein n=1 Tax=Candidatus Yanofskybacteria bacterium CG10_big_fil_rev_8_21_14_0_10_46_23 TaxID=1975098 RepID=A0A2H0R471_9BACT|nr:MAG: hypothetical protein COV31_03065 [Candidatus Yanofskybacteria bacterium CG10_big_fil_rev_8_21_14_0_10_46_23]